jgi:DNA-binding transcriptional LysR family regulator
MAILCSSSIDGLRFVIRRNTANMRSKGENLFGGISVFAAVVDAGTFAAASEMMGISPPGVSRAISRLEKRLQIRLFNRTTRSVSLTEDGRRFYEQVMPHLAGLEEAAAIAASGASAVHGKLRVNLDPVFYRVILGQQLDKFMDAYPDLEIEFIARDNLGDLVLDGFDLALRFGEPKASTLIARKLFDTRVVTVATPAYIARWGARQSRTISKSRSTDAWNFATRRLVNRSPGSSTTSANALRLTSGGVSQSTIPAHFSMRALLVQELHRCFCSAPSI